MVRTYIIKQTFVLTLAVLSILLIPLSVFAADNDTAAISQGFQVQGEVVPGALVSFVNDKGDSRVGTANTKNVEKLVGVVGQKQLIELSTGAGETQVVTSGSVLVLVSNINGDVKIGDKITASPLSGIGMKAIETTRVVGTAQENFSDSEKLSDQQVTDVSGATQTVKVGLVRVQVAVAYYQPPVDDFSFLPAFLRNVASTVAGHTVDPIRVLVSLVLLIASFGGVAVLLYSSVRSSITSIGRNPLSAAAVHKSLLEVGLTAFSVLLLTLVGVYLVLTI